MLQSIEFVALAVIVAAIGLYMMVIGIGRIIRAMRRAPRAAAPAVMPKLVAAAKLVPVATPEADSPLAFGWSTAWLAIRTRDTAKVVDALGLKERQRIGWQSGLAAVHDDGLADDHVLVTPAVNGWTFVIGYALPHPSADPRSDRGGPLLAALARQFDDVQYFFSGPALDLFAWSRYQSGTLMRRYATAGVETLFDEGMITEAELRHGLAPARQSNPGGVGKWRPVLVGAVASPHSLPSEDMLLQIAGAWSLNPSLIDTAMPLTGAGAAPALGFLGRVPATWRHRGGDRKAG